MPMTDALRQEVETFAGMFKRDIPDVEVDLESAMRGGTAIAFRAQDVGLDIPVCLKVIVPISTMVDGFTQRMQAEARAMARLRHENIVTVLRTGLLDSRYVWILMDWMPGGDLHQLIVREGPQSTRRSIELIIGILRGLQRVHEGGKIHRDMKPANVLLDEKGTPKIADFGLVRDSSGPALTRVGVLMGSGVFIPPEQSDKRTDIDRRADLFSVGIILYCLGTGDANPRCRHGFEDDVNREGHPVKEAADTLGPLAAVIRRATQAERDDRYQSAAEMIAALEAVQHELPEEPVEEAPVAEVPPPPVVPEPVAIHAPASADGADGDDFLDDEGPEPVAGRPDRPRWPLAAAALVALVALIALGAVVWPTSQATPDPPAPAASVAPQDIEVEQPVGMVAAVQEETVETDEEVEEAVAELVEEPPVTEPKPPKAKVKAKAEPPPAPTPEEATPEATVTFSGDAHQIYILTGNGRRHDLPATLEPGTYTLGAVWKEGATPFTRPITLSPGHTSCTRGTAGLVCTPP